VSGAVRELPKCFQVILGGRRGGGAGSPALTGPDESFFANCWAGRATCWREGKMATILIADHRRSPSPASRYLPIISTRTTAASLWTWRKACPKH